LIAIKTKLGSKKSKTAEKDSVYLNIIMLFPNALHG